MHHHNAGIEQKGKVEEGLGKSCVVFPRDKPLKWHSIIKIDDYFNCPDTLDSNYMYRQKDDALIIEIEKLLPHRKC